MAVRCLLACLLVVGGTAIVAIGLQAGNEMRFINDFRNIDDENKANVRFELQVSGERRTACVRNSQGGRERSRGRGRERSRERKSHSVFSVVAIALCMRDEEHGDCDQAANPARGGDSS